MTTKIEWATETWNPITGCRPISEGCAHCYAQKMAKRLAGRFGYDKKFPFRVTWHEDKLNLPERWKKPRAIFVCSMGDMFHEAVPEGWLHKAFDVMSENDRHTYLLLTKRPERMAEYVGGSVVRFMRHVWIGVTAENQKQWLKRVPVLMEIKAAGVKFVSVEPMLGPIQLAGQKPDWVICGGETGPGARLMHKQDGFNLLYECDMAGIPFFFKKLGGGRSDNHLDAVREYPK